MLQSETIALFGGRKVEVHRAGQGPTIVWLHGRTACAGTIR